MLTQPTVTFGHVMQPRAPTARATGQGRCARRASCPTGPHAGGRHTARPLGRTELRSWVRLGACGERPGCRVPPGRAWNRRPRGRVLPRVRPGWPPSGSANPLSWWVSPEAAGAAGRSIGAEIVAFRVPYWGVELLSPIAMAVVALTRAGRDHGEGQEYPCAKVRRQGCGRCRSLRPTSRQGGC